MSLITRLSDLRPETKIPPSEEGREPVTTPGLQSARGLHTCSTNQRPQPVHVRHATRDTEREDDQCCRRVPVGATQASLRSFQR